MIVPVPDTPPISSLPCSLEDWINETSTTEEGRLLLAFLFDVACQYGPHWRRCGCRTCFLVYYFIFCCK